MVLFGISMHIVDSIIFFNGSNASDAIKLPTARLKIVIFRSKKFWLRKKVEENMLLNNTGKCIAHHVSTSESNSIDARYLLFSLLWWSCWIDYSTPNKRANDKKYRKWKWKIHFSKDYLNIHFENNFVVKWANFISIMENFSFQQSNVEQIVFQTIILWSIVEHIHP